MQRRLFSTALALTAMASFAGAAQSQERPYIPPPPPSLVGSLMQVGVVDRSTGAELPVYRHRGEYWVAGRPGARYAIRVRNAMGERIMAVMSVDGVNVVTGETAGVGQNGYVFGPRERSDITGWRKSDSQIAAFEFAAAGNSYASRTGRPDDVGVIGVAMFRERMPEPPPPVVVVTTARPRGSARAEGGGAVLDHPGARLLVARGVGEGEAGIDGGQVGGEADPRLLAEVLEPAHDPVAARDQDGVVRVGLGLHARIAQDRLGLLIGDGHAVLLPHLDVHGSQGEHLEEIGRVLPGDGELLRHSGEPGLRDGERVGGPVESGGLAEHGPPRVGRAARQGQARDEDGAGGEEARTARRAWGHDGLLGTTRGLRPC